MDSEEQYNKICKPQLEEIKQRITQQKEEFHVDFGEMKDKIDKIYSYVFENGLQAKVQKNSIYIGLLIGISTCVGTVLVWKLFGWII